MKHTIATIGLYMLNYIIKSKKLYPLNPKFVVQRLHWMKFVSE